MQPTQNGLLPSTEPDQARPYVIDMLDSLRRQREAYQVNRHRCLLLARKHGLTLAEIAEYIGMSESGVRYVIAESGGGR